MPLDVFKVQLVSLACDVDGCSAVSEDFDPNEDADTERPEDEIRHDPGVQEWARSNGWVYNPTTGIVICPLHAPQSSGQ